MKKIIYSITYLLINIFCFILAFLILEKVSEYSSYGKIGFIQFQVIITIIYSSIGVVLSLNKIYKFFKNKDCTKPNINYNLIFIIAIPLLIISFLPNLYWFMGIKLPIIVKNIINSQMVSIICKISFGYYLCAGIFNRKSK